MNIYRYYDNFSFDKLTNRVAVIYGARRIGKTTLVKSYIEKIGSTKRIISVTGEDARIQELFKSHNLERITDFFNEYDLVFIDEAQNINDAGLGLKMLFDNSENKTIIITGSSSLDLSYKLGEPLTGRQKIFKMFPVSYSELQKSSLVVSLNDMLTYGMYPEVLTQNSRTEKIEIINEIVESYLLKDVLQFGEIRNPSVIKRLLTALAYQIGSLVSLNELSGLLGIDVKTVQRYLDLLEQCFIITKLTGYSRNLRKEMTKKNKYYFNDVGIRNALIGDFNEPDIRGDIGSLFENFAIIERLKQQQYGGIKHARNYFWRSQSSQEIDLIEEYDGALHATELKWKNKPVKLPTEFSAVYSSSSFEVVSKDNIHDWLLESQIL